ncbi:hypothetical protein JG688_00014121 [Phytophthora aleatoria]|uniref:Uncharacterized protein n=1 Tax=Phytophthora aleatoria TaxID=2496075 RepID=A0A8J5LXR8_9STRA|nr:hypothetical protein JG688_00014121 [Phytophthora aleatoria]
MDPHVPSTTSLFLRPTMWMVWSTHHCFQLHQSLMSPVTSTTPRLIKLHLLRSCRFSVRS